MAWVTTKRTRTDDGLLFEFSGDKVDQQGRPFKTTSAFIPLVARTPDTPPDLPALVVAQLEARAVQRVIADLGDGSDVAKPSLLTRLFRRAR